jgi:hypothetical protein
MLVICSVIIAGAFPDRRGIEQQYSMMIVFLFISQDGKEVETVKEMLESAVRMIWDSALCYKMAH